MKRPCPREAALTLIEVLVVIAVVAVVIAMYLQMRSPSPDGTTVTGCLFNLKQIDIGFLMYTTDNGGKFPMQHSTTNGGTMEFLQRNQTFPHYQKLSQYFSSATMLVCPADKNRHAATNFQTLGDTNLSYFLNADVSTNNPSVLILAGDRNLQADGQPLPPGLFSVSTNVNMAFTREFHPTVGALAFADGHAEACRKTNLDGFIKRQNLTSVRFSIP